MEKILEVNENQAKESIDVKTQIKSWFPSQIKPDATENIITMHNMSVVIDQVEPHIIECLDIDLR